MPAMNMANTGIPMSLKSPRSFSSGEHVDAYHTTAMMVGNFQSVHVSRGRPTSCVDDKHLR